MAFGKQPRINREIDFVTDEDGNLLGYKREPFEDTTPMASAQFVSVKDFGAVGDGITDDTAAIQAALNDDRFAPLLIPPGRYRITSDLTVPAVGNGPTERGRVISAHGAYFIGTSKLIVSGSKKVKIEGLDAANMTLTLRGVWHSNFEAVKFSVVLINDAAGNGFSSNYWNTFNGCQFQNITVSENSTEPSNEFSFYGCTFRGDSGQGFSGSMAWCLSFGRGNAQSWKFYGGDISYHTAGIIEISPTNINDVELLFSGLYFDTLFPEEINRPRTIITIENCHSANNIVQFATLSAASVSSRFTYRSDRSSGRKDFTGVNFIPNGDFRKRLNTYVGTNLPIAVNGGAVVTPVLGSSLSGLYLNINAAGNNTCRFRAPSLPFNGIYTGTLVVRSASGAPQPFKCAFNNKFFTEDALSTEWSVFTLTDETQLLAGGLVDIQIAQPDGFTGYNVDIAYAGITFGRGGQVFQNSVERTDFTYQVTFDAPSLAAGATATTTVSVPGALVGDFAVASASIPSQGVSIRAYVEAADSVTIYIVNETATTIDLPSATYYVRVFKRGFV